jgi:hypothetical protein
MTNRRTLEDVQACPKCGRVWAPIDTAPTRCPVDGARPRRCRIVPRAELEAARAELAELVLARAELGEISATLSEIHAMLAPAAS